MMNFIRWFKGSLEDEKGVASFRRIYNYIIITLASYVVIETTEKNHWTMLIIYVLIVLLVAGFLNTSVITTDNILRFFNREKLEPEKPPIEQKATIQGNVILTNQEKTQ